MIFSETEKGRTWALEEKSVTNELLKEGEGVFAFWHL